MSKMSKKRAELLLDIAEKFVIIEMHLEEESERLAKLSRKWKSQQKTI